MYLISSEGSILFGVGEPGCGRAVNTKVYFFQVVGCGIKPSYLAHFEANPWSYNGVQMSSPNEQSK